MSDDLLDTLDRVVDRAEGAEAVEAFGVDETETEVHAYGGEVESLTSARTRGVGIRLVTEARVGYAYTADLTEAAMDDALEQARANAAVATPDEGNVLPEAATVHDMPELVDPGLAATPPEEKADLAIRLEQAVRDADERIKGVDTARYGDGDTRAAIASTTGIRQAYRRTDCFVVVEALAEAEGASTSAYGLSVARRPDALDVDGAAAEAASRVTRLLGGRKPATARMPVLLDPFVTASLLGVLAGGLTGEAVQKGRSLFADKLGERLGAAHLTLVDDGRRTDGLAAAPWDGEGVPTGRTALIDGGTLTAFLHNTRTAARGGTVSTGNASRSGFKSPPGVSPTNLYLEPGPDGPEALLARAGDAFYCQQVLGVHSGASPVTGDISVGAAGLMVRDGAFAEPVREASIAGTVPGMLAGIAAVGSDLRFLPFGGGMGGATVLVDGMTVSGA